MTTFTMEEFNPTKEQLLQLADSYRHLSIASADDEEWKELVKVARKELVSKRTEIEKTGKRLREWALKFQKDVIAKEKEYISIIEPVELYLKSEEKRIADEEETNNRKESLPLRKQELLDIGITDYQDEFLLSMSGTEFSEFVGREKTRLFDEKIQKDKEEEQKKQREQELEKAKLEAAAKATKDAEEKIAREKQQAEEAQKRVEQQKIEDQKKLEAQEEYQKFLSDNWYGDDGTWYILVEWSTRTLCRKIATFTFDK